MGARRSVFSQPRSKKLQTFLGFLNDGLLAAPWWAMVLFLLAATQLTVLSVTLYLHRAMAHRGVDLHPLVTHPMRFWLWLTTGMVTREWVAIHRKHHARCETAEDPHSPQIHGIRRVLLDGAGLYQQESNCAETIEKYGHGCPDDWVERHVYRRSVLGPTLMLFLSIAAFGAIGISIWAVQMMWIPLFAAGVINGLGHWMGYRNFATEDTSHNLVPWAVWLGGEELHNNHHAFPSSAKFALKEWEFDIGWMLLQGLSKLKLAEVRRVAPQLQRAPVAEATVDQETLRAVFAHRFTVMTDYCRHVIQPLVHEEASRARNSIVAMRRRTRRVLSGNQRFFCADKRQHLSRVLAESHVLATAYEYRMRLQALWDRSTTDPDALLAGLRQWCREAEESGIEALREFAERMSAYRLANA